MSSLISPQPRDLGRFDVGRVGFGCWRFTNATVREATTVLEEALALGMNLIDTADVYGLDWGGTGFGANESILGSVLAATPSLRDELVLATKGGIMPPVPYDSGAASIIKACEASLRRLQVDVIDLYQIHRPDPFTHPEELAGALISLREGGKIIEVGVSNHGASQTDALQAYLPFPLASDQPEYSLCHLDPLRDGVFDRCLRESTTPLAWSPLGGGALASGEGVRPELVEVLDQLAEREGVSRAVIAVGFVLAHPARPVALVGSQRPERLRELAGAVSVQLDRSDVYRLIQAADGVPLP